MKLSEYAKQTGVSYKTAYRWFKSGKLDGYQAETGTIIIRVQKDAPKGIALYARVSSADQQDDLDRQVERLKTYAFGKGYQVDKIVTEIASGVNDSRPKLTKLLRDMSIGVIIVENRDRLTRFGFNYISELLDIQDRQIEVVFPGDTKDDLVNDFVAIITSMAARIYDPEGTPRGNKRRAEKIRKCIEGAENEDC